MFGKRLPRSILLCQLITIAKPSLGADYVTSNTSTPHDNTPNCTCYVLNSGTNSTDPQYFQFYRFYDFRHLASSPGQYLNAPSAPNDNQLAGSAKVWNADILDSEQWKTDWSIQNWSKPATDDSPIPMSNSPANIYLLQNNSTDDSDTYLTLRTSRIENFQSAAEIENVQRNLLHASIRMYGRVVGAKGAVAGFFTYFDDNNESDIEILTRDATDTIHYTNQPSLDKHGNVIAVASQVPSGLASWDQWHMHRIDWLSQETYWYLDNQQVAANRYSVPRKPSGLTFNMWSDGGDWSGNMSIGSSAEFQLQWIEMTFNASGPASGAYKGNTKREERLEKKKKSRGCEVVCKIDGVNIVGTPEIITVNTNDGCKESATWGILLSLFISICFLL